MKNTGGLGEISIRIVEAFTYDRTSEIHLMAVHCVAASAVDYKKEKSG